jgi:hypothetical protein
VDTPLSSDRTLRRIAGISTLLAVVIGAVSGVLFLAAADLRWEPFLEPAQLLRSGPSAPSLLRWGALTDMFGYYLLFVSLFLAVGTPCVGPTALWWSICSRWEPSCTWSSVELEKKK